MNSWILTVDPICLFAGHCRQDLNTDSRIYQNMPSNWNQLIFFLRWGRIPSICPPLFRSSGGEVVFRSFTFVLAFANSSRNVCGSSGSNLTPCWVNHRWENGLTILLASTLQSTIALQIPTSLVSIPITADSARGYRTRDLILGRRTGSNSQVCTNCQFSVEWQGNARFGTAYLMWWYNS